MAEVSHDVAHIVSPSNVTHDLFSCIFCLSDRRAYWWGESYVRRIVERIEPVAWLKLRCTKCGRMSTENYRIPKLGGLALCFYCTSDIVLDAMQRISIRYQLAIRQ